MARALSIGERMDIGNTFYDETRRFQLILQPDGNLVVYTLIPSIEESSVKRVAVGDTGSYNQYDIYMDLNDWGGIRLRNMFTHVSVWEQRKNGVRVGPVDGKYEKKPKATLHIQADGNAVIYGDFPQDVLWASGVYNRNRPPLPAGSLYIPVEGEIKDSGSEVLVNESGDIVTVEDSKGTYTTIPNAGSLRINLAKYEVVKVADGATFGGGDGDLVIKRPGQNVFVIK